jgi:NAD-dependent DNA ligase
MNRIYEEYGDEMFDVWAGKSVGEVTAEISKIPGFKETTAKLFAKGINSFKAFLKRNKAHIAFKEKEAIKQVGSSLAGQSFLWSKCRQHNLEPLIRENGGEVLGSFRNGCTYLIAPEGETSGKIEKARKLGTKIMTPESMLKYLKSKGVL